MIGLQFDRPLRTIVCLGAHVDDIEIGAGGTIAHLSTDYPDASFEFVVATAPGVRADEALDSARALLGERVTVHLGDFDDGFVPYHDPSAVKRFFRSACGAVDPDLVIAPSTSDLHQDHRFVAETAHQLFRSQTILEYEILKYDGDLGRPSIYVPLSSSEAQEKFDHLAQHFASQHLKPWYNSEAFASLMRIRAIECHAPGGYAEAFHARRVVIR